MVIDNRLGPNFGKPIECREVSKARHAAEARATNLYALLLVERANYLCWRKDGHELHEAGKGAFAYWIEEAEAQLRAEGKI